MKKPWHLLFSLVVFTTLFYQSSFGQRDCIYLNDSCIKKVALIIGQSNYFHYDTLVQGAADANAMAHALTQKGFTVLKYVDLNSGSLRFFIDQWRERSKKYEVVLFYFSGHGVQIDGEDYLVPIDGKFYKTADVKEQCYNLNELIRSIDLCGHLADVILYDACRADIAAQKKHSKGILSDKNEKRTYVGFAASHGDIIVSQTKDSLSLYTHAIIRNMARNITLDELFAAAREEVVAATNQRQVPEKSSSSIIEICMGPAIDEE